MLYEVITKILDKAKEKGVDILVARDMIIHEGKLPTEVIKNAYNDLNAYYDVFTKFRRENTPGLIKELCDLIEQGNEIAIKKFISEHK